MEVVEKNIQNVDYVISFPKNDKAMDYVDLTIYGNGKMYQMKFNKDSMNSLHDIIKTDIDLLIRLLYNFIGNNEELGSVELKDDKCVLTLETSIIGKIIRIPLTIPVVNMSPENLIDYKLRRMQKLILDLHNRVSRLEKYNSSPDEEKVDIMNDEEITDMQPKKLAKKKTKK